jgi:hypothetical protein
MVNRWLTVALIALLGTAALLLSPTPVRGQGDCYGLTPALDENYRRAKEAPYRG